MAAAFGGSRGVAAKAPEKGVFPLDHFGECKTFAADYLACLKREKGDSLECKRLSKRYLECRMDANLMAREDLSKLGFRQGDSESAPGKATSKSASGEQARQRAKRGFVPGVRGQ
ncbi:cytochrome c oxidase assembly protein COX19 [Chloropicon roscoffensis]|uniref:Cytochrome c oxidase assembly protein COX19 n=1 Tax=Chloropicon roscoffensis TaxID=1461544 RepID=A0A7S3FS13_9CHLO|mmetsp:Transcript_9968/g.30341  ORF Transcript_9968/g.30341 Transcript_9968/m.30341 type:complete len:115 (+) Transcript_9968:70-414(+)